MDTQYVVVLLSSDACAADSDTRCVSEVYGPYVAAQREAALKGFPPGFTPHWIKLKL